MRWLNLDNINEKELLKSLVFMFTKEKLYRMEEKNKTEKLIGKDIIYGKRI